MNDKGDDNNRGKDTGEEGETEDEETMLNKAIEDLTNKYEETKIKVAENKKILDEERENGRQFEQKITQELEDIANIEDNIKFFDSKIQKFDIHQNNNTFQGLQMIQEDDKIFQILNSSKMLTCKSDISAIKWVKRYEVENNLRIFKTEKLKFVNHLGNLYNGIADLFSVYSTKFTEMQGKIESISKSMSEVGPDNLNGDKYSNPDQRIFDAIAVKILYKGYLTSDELDSCSIDCVFNVESIQEYKIAVIEYDHLFNIEKAYSVLHIQSLACKYFGLNDAKHFLVDNMFRIWPYDVVLYDEIYSINVERCAIRPHGRFFQFNPEIAVGMKLILIHKEYMVELIARQWDNFRFVDLGFATRKSPIASHMMTKLKDVRDNLDIYKEAENIRKIQKSKMAKELLKDQLFQMFKAVDLQRSQTQEREIVKSVPVPVAVPVPVPVPNPNKKSKIFVSKRKEKKPFKLSEEQKEKISEKFKNVLDELNMDIENLISYCEEIFENTKNIEEVVQENEYENIIDKKLHYAISEIIKNKESRIIPRKYLLNDKFQTNNEYFHRKLINYYLTKQKEEQGELKAKLNAEKTQEEQEEDPGKVNPTGVDNNVTPGTTISMNKAERSGTVPLYLRLLEVVVIVMFIAFGQIVLNKIPILDISEFQKSVERIFQEKRDCPTEWRNMQSYDEISDWLLNCFYEPLSTYFYTFYTPGMGNIMAISATIKITNRKIVNCTGYDTLNIKFVNNSIPFCQSEDILFFDDLKKNLIDSTGVTTTKNYISEVLSFMDTLFFQDNKNVLNGTKIDVSLESDLWNLYKFLWFINIYRCEVMKINSKCDEIYPSSTIREFISKVRALTLPMNETYNRTIEHNNVELVDYTTRKMIIDIHFTNKDFSMISAVTFSYESAYNGLTMKKEMTSNAVQYDVGANAFNRDIYEQIQNLRRMDYETFLTTIVALKGQASSVYIVDNSIVAYSIISYSLFFLILACNYAKSLFFASFREVLSRSFFLVFFIIVFGLENVYTFYQYLIGSKDYMFVPQLLQSRRMVDISELYFVNLKILRAFSVLILMYHMILVVFDLKKIIVFNIFLRPVFQRFLLVLIVINLAFSVLFTVYSGTMYQEFGGLWVSIVNVINCSFGINIQSTTSDQHYTLKDKNTRYYFTIINYVLRVISMNFALMLMFYYVTKNAVINKVELDKTQNETKEENKTKKQGKSEVKQKKKSKSSRKDLDNILSRL